jgi:hypothetical protein
MLESKLTPCFIQRFFERAWLEHPSSLQMLIFFFLPFLPEGVVLAAIVVSVSREEYSSSTGDAVTFTGTVLTTAATAAMSGKALPWS